MKYADLHLHTYFSDGTYSVEELIKQAVEQDLSCIAITDHDTIDGYIYLKNNLSKFPLEVICGIELTCDMNGKEVHILGYFLDYKNRALLDTCDSIKKDRKKRIQDMVLKLKDLGIGLDSKDVFDLAKKGVVGRLHLARVMVEKGYCSSIKEAFLKYIGDESPAYINRFLLTPEKAVKLIIQAKGIPVLAHPYMLQKNGSIDALIDAGIKGIEVYYPEHRKKQIKEFLGIAKRNNLLVTGGSDCHGNAKSSKLIGRIRLPYSFVEELKKNKSKNEE
ncbi:MAG: PHP domain-containing protein [Candidatus Gygaella obscura]|nr:PHP domain-containing protein [Candidatus Gygaella obscura]